MLADARLFTDDRPAVLEPKGERAQQPERGGDDEAGGGDGDVQQALDAVVVGVAQQVGPQQPVGRNTLGGDGAQQPLCKRGLVGHAATGGDAGGDGLADFEVGDEIGADDDLVDVRGFEDVGHLPQVSEAGANLFELQLFGAPQTRAGLAG